MAEDIRLKDDPEALGRTLGASEEYEKTYDPKAGIRIGETGRRQLPGAQPTRRFKPGAQSLTEQRATEVRIKKLEDLDNPSILRSVDSIYNIKFEEEDGNLISLPAAFKKYGKTTYPTSEAQLERLVTEHSKIMKDYLADIQRESISTGVGGAPVSISAIRKYQPTRTSEGVDEDWTPERKEDFQSLTEEEQDVKDKEEVEDDTIEVGMPFERTFVHDDGYEQTISVINKGRGKTTWTAGPEASDFQGRIIPFKGIQAGNQVLQNLRNPSSDYDKKLLNQIPKKDLIILENWLKYRKRETSPQLIEGKLAYPPSGEDWQQEKAKEARELYMKYLKIPKNPNDPVSEPKYGFLNDDEFTGIPDFYMLENTQRGFQPREFTQDEWTVFSEKRLDKLEINARNRRKKGLEYTGEPWTKRGPLPHTGAPHISMDVPEEEWYYDVATQKMKSRLKIQPEIIIEKTVDDEDVILSGLEISEIKDPRERKIAMQRKLEHEFIGPKQPETVVTKLDDFTNGNGGFQKALTETVTDTSIIGPESSTFANFMVGKMKFIPTDKKEASKTLGLGVLPSVEIATAKKDKVIEDAREEAERKAQAEDKRYIRQLNLKIENQEIIIKQRAEEQRLQDLDDAQAEDDWNALTALQQRVVRKKDKEKSLFHLQDDIKNSAEEKIVSDAVLNGLSGDPTKNRGPTNSYSSRPNGKAGENGTVDKKGDTYADKNAANKKKSDREAAQRQKEWHDKYDKSKYEHGGPGSQTVSDKISRLQWAKKHFLAGGDVASRLASGAGGELARRRDYKLRMAKAQGGGRRGAIDSLEANAALIKALLGAKQQPMFGSTMTAFGQETSGMMGGGGQSALTDFGKVALTGGSKLTDMGARALSGGSALTDMGVRAVTGGSTLTDFSTRIGTTVGHLGGALAQQMTAGEGGGTRGIFTMGEKFLRSRQEPTSLILMKGREKDITSFSLGGTLGLGASMRPEQGLGSPSGFLSGELIPQRQLQETQNRAPNNRNNGAGIWGRRR